MKILSHLFLPGYMTNLERMVANRAIGSSIISTLSNEASIERYLLEFSNIHSSNVWIFSIVGICLYGQYKYLQGTNTKLVDIPIYTKYERTIRELLFIVFMVFTRDVQHAS